MTLNRPATPCPHFRFPPSFPLAESSDENRMTVRRVAPFACGPLDIRSRPLALLVSRCHHAETYFAIMSRFAAHSQQMCVSADGSQGTAMSWCVDSVDVVDFSSSRQRFATIRQLNNTNGVSIVHPNKKGILTEWMASWNFMRRSAYMCETPCEFPPAWSYNDSHFSGCTQTDSPRNRSFIVDKSIYVACHENSFKR